VPFLDLVGTDREDRYNENSRSQLYSSLHRHQLVLGSANEQVLHEELPMSMLRGRAGDGRRNLHENQLESLVRIDRNFRSFRMSGCRMERVGVNSRSLRRDCRWIDTGKNDLVGVFHRCGWVLEIGLAGNEGRT